MRIRTIKPEFWTDEAVMECSLSARLLLIGCLNVADDEGSLERSPIQIKAKIFPCDNIKVEPLLVELITNGLLIEYSVDGKKYLHIKGFRKHQVINRKSKNRCPVYEESMITHTTLTESSLQEVEGKGGEVITTLSGKPDFKQQALEVLGFLNEKTGRNYQAVEANIEKIVARLKAGASVDDMRAVVAKKCREWGPDEKMNQYLRPATLFNREKYAQYEGELRRRDEHMS